MEGFTYTMSSVSWLSDAKMTTFGAFFVQNVSVRHRSLASIFKWGITKKVNFADRYIRPNPKNAYFVLCPTSLPN
jgi:hypothetical protein